MGSVAGIRVSRASRKRIAGINHFFFIHDRKLRPVDRRLASVVVKGFGQGYVHERTCYPGATEIERKDR